MSAFAKVARPEPSRFAIAIDVNSVNSPLETHEFPSVAYWRAWMNFCDAAKLLWKNNPSSKELSDLAELVGRYELADVLVEQLKRKGVSLLRGCIPFASPLDRIQNFLSVEPPAQLWDAKQIQAWAGKKNFRLEQICLPDSEWPFAQALLQNYQGEADLWRFLAAWEALMEHSQESFQLSFTPGG